MPHPSSSPTEQIRLTALAKLDIMDSLPEEEFDDIVALASEICSTPIGLVSLVDGERQWFKARTGLAAEQTPRDQAFCAHAILAPEALMLVEDATRDPRFRSNPLVTGSPDIRFYAGAPILAPDGSPLGTVCVIDTKPRQLSPAQANALRALARQVSALLRLRAANIAQEKQQAELKRLMAQALAGDLDDHRSLQHRQRVASIGQLTSGLAHDFNNLLQTINGSLQLITRRADRPEVKRWAFGAMDAVKRGAKLTAHLLAFSRSHQIARTSVDVDRFLENMRDLLDRSLGPEVVLTFGLGAGNAQTNIDPTQLESAVLNLCINARDAMNGAGTVDISTAMVHHQGDLTLAGGDYIRLCVQDTGPGMPLQVAERAFDAFFTTKAVGAGTGLGLAQVYGFATQAGGIARIECPAQGGTCVSLWLAVAGSSSTTQDDRTVVADEPLHPMSRTRILVVDDDPAQCVVWAELLGDAGYDVRSALTAAAALEAAEQELPEVVVVDCGMPGTNGSILAQRLASKWPELPIVFMTGYGDTDGFRPLLRSNAMVLAKPVSLEDLTKAIATVGEKI